MIKTPNPPPIGVLGGGGIGWAKSQVVVLINKMTIPILIIFQLLFISDKVNDLA